jgi:hypothetical protein
MANSAQVNIHERTNSKAYIALLPPAGFHTSRLSGIITLSDGTPLKPDSRGVYRLDYAQAHLLRG